MNIHTENRENDMGRGAVVSMIVKAAIMVILVVISIDKNDRVSICACVIGMSLTMLLPYALKRIFKITMPWVLDLLITVAILIHILGNVFQAYHTIPHYDDLAHFVSASAVAFSTLIFIYIVGKYWKGLQTNMYSLAFLVIITTMAMGVVWEFREWSTDLILGWTLQKNIQDTRLDLFVNTMAGIFIAILGVTLIKLGKLQKMTNDLEKEVESWLNKRKKP